MQRLAANKPHDTQEGFDAANVTRETDMLSSVTTNQNTDTSEELFRSDDVGGSSASIPAASTNTAKADQSGDTSEISAGVSPDSHDEPDHDFDEDEWLKTFARVVVAAIGPDESVVVDASKGQFVDGLSKDASDRAKTIINYARQACRGEIEPDDAREIIAGKAKTEVRDIL